MYLIPLVRSFRFSAWLPHSPLLCPPSLSLTSAASSQLPMFTAHGQGPCRRLWYTHTVLKETLERAIFKARVGFRKMRRW